MEGYMRIGILGQGSIGKRHANNLRDLGHDVLTYDPIIYQTIPKAHSRERVLRTSDAIIIASPTPQHFQDICDVVDAKKPMLIEKPLISADPKLLPRIIEKLGSSGLPAYMGFNLRFHEAVRKAKEWLPRIGRPIDSNFMVAQKTEKPAYLRDSVLNNWGAHELDIILWMFGPGTITSSGIKEDSAWTTIHHQTGMTSCLYCDYKTDPERRWFTIFGTDGRVECNLVARQAAAFVGDRCSAILKHASDSWDQNYFDEIKSWLNQIQGLPGDCATWQDGVAVQELVIQAYERNK